MRTAARLCSLINWCFGFGGDQLDLDAGRLGQVGAHHLRPGRVALEPTRPLIEIDQGDAHAVIGFLTEAFAQEQAENRDEQQWHDQEQQRRQSIAHQQAQFLYCQRPNDVHNKVSNRECDERQADACPHVGVCFVGEK